MKILIITNDFPPKKGGISSYINGFVENLDAECIIYAPNWAEGPNVINAKSKFIFKNKQAIDEIKNIVLDRDIDCILHASSNPQFLLVRSLKKLNKPQFMIVHGAEFNILNSIPFVKRYLQLSFDNLDKIFTVSFFTQRKLQSLTSTEVILIGAGVEKNNFVKNYFKEGRIVIGVSSRFVSRKKIDWVIDVLHNLNQDGYESELKIFGYGKLEDYYQKLSEISSQPIQFLKDNHTDSIANFYKDIDLFVMPAKSRLLGKEFEGLGLVYLEAGSYGLPVLVGTSGGAFETVLPGKTGFIVSSKAEIYEAVKYFITNPHEIERFGLASKNFVQSNFSWNINIEKFKKSLLEVLGS